MKPFNHKNATSLEDAADALSRGNASVIAGGTDILGTLKDGILPDYPSLLVNIKSIPGLDYIREEVGALKIGASARLSEIADHPVVKEKYAALGQAAASVGTPHLRNMGTIGGSIVQLPRCWYFRKLRNRFHCIRKGGEECFAILGDARYHSIFGGVRVGAPPCSQSCPAGTDIPAYLALFRDGNRDKAAQTIMKSNPMPAITSRVCAHFCQQGCNRGQTDESVMICAIERVLGDYILENSGKFYVPPENETGKSVAIVGTGAAGLSAAYYLRKAGHRVTVYDGKEEAGDVLMYAIPAYRLPKDIVRKYVKSLENMGVVFRLGVIVDGDIKPEESEYDGVLFATGAWKRPVIGIDGEEPTMTSKEGVFSIADATTGPNTVPGAIAGGRRASEGINRYLGLCADANAPIEENVNEFISHDAKGIANVKALKLRELDSDKRRLDIEDSQTPTDDEAMTEASRCLNCGCYAAHSSDIAPALIALNATIVTNTREISADEFFAVKTPGNTVLEGNEIIAEIRVPAPSYGSVSTFMKFALRKAIDFPLVNCAVMIGGESPRICLGAVAPKPYRAFKAEAVIAGKKIDEALAQSAGEAAVLDATPFPSSRYKAQIAKTLVKRALLYFIDSGKVFVSK